MKLTVFINKDSGPFPQLVRLDPFSVQLSLEARLLLGIPANPEWRLRADLDLKGDGVVCDDVAVGPGYVAPSLLIGEYVRDIPGELVTTPRVQDPQVRRCQARPRCVPLLQTALEEHGNVAEAATLSNTV